MNITIADIKVIMKRKMFQYANCNLSVNNPYYVNDGAIKNAEAWFKRLCRNQKSGRQENRKHS